MSPDGKKIVFTSVRDGDLELYTMNIDGSEVRRLTNKLGYDGGGFFSPNGKQIVFRAFHPTKKEEIDRYHTLLAHHLVEPKTLEIFVIDATGNNTPHRMIKEVRTSKTLLSKKEDSLDK